LAVAVLAGSYPALLLSAFKPAQVLRGKIGPGLKDERLRKLLVVTQFVLTISLSICSVMIYRQLEFMKERELGYDRDQQVSISLKGEARNTFDILKGALLKNHLGMTVTGVGDDLPYFDWGTEAVRWPGGDPSAEILFNFNVVDVDFIESLGITLVEGHSFSPAHTTNPRSGIIVNEAMLRLMGLEQPIGTELQVWGKPLTIIGIMRDCHFQPLTRTIAPIFFIHEPERISHLLARVEPGRTEESLRHIRQVWEEVLPGYPFEFEFVKDQYERSLLSVIRMSDLARFLTVIAVIIAYVGLFGLASFTVEQRSKEIGIRKVLGASSGRVIRMLCAEYIRYIAAATLIAWPLAWWSSQEWLAGYTYRTGIAPELFLLVPLAALAMAVLTVGGEAWRTARANPVDSIRLE
jgi:hypothetical protein